jgi:hypothetical protein
MIKMKQVRETSYLTIIRPTLEYRAQQWFVIPLPRISEGKTFDILCLFCRSYGFICAWKGWLYVSLWKLLFVFLYHWHFGGLKKSCPLVMNNYTSRAQGCVTSMLTSLELQTLEQRRRISRLIMMYKILVSFWSTADWSDQNCLFTTRELDQRG